MELPNSSIFNFKRFLLRILLPLLLVTGIVGFAFDYFFEKQIIFKNQLCNAYKVNRIIRETHPAEIPIFGSSRAEGSFIPDSLGPGYFNYGISGSKTDVALFFIREECRKKKSNPYIIVALDYDRLIGGIGDIANYIPCANYAPVKKLLGDNYRQYYSVPFVRYYGMFDTYLKLYANNKLQLTKISNKGAALEKTPFSATYFKDVVNMRLSKPVEFLIDKRLHSGLLQLVAENPGRYFIFVASPYHSSYFKSMVNYTAVEGFLAGLSEYKNVKVLDFSKMPLPDSFFLNTSHLNYEGAMAFSHSLKDSLAKVVKVTQ